MLRRQGGTGSGAVPWIRGPGGEQLESAQKVVRGVENRESGALDGSMQLGHETSRQAKGYSRRDAMRPKIDAVT